MSVELAVSSILLKANLKITNTRKTIINTILSHNGAISYSKIQEELNLDRVTLYRTLNAFLHNGIIHKAYQDENQIYFAICGNDCNSRKHEHNHAHLVCNRCKSITCQPLNKPVNIVLPSFHVEEISITINGICSACKT